MGLLVPEKISKSFNHTLIWAWWPTWSCDQVRFYKFMPCLLNETHIKFGFDWPIGFREIFENNGHIHIYSPTDNPLGSAFCNKHTVNQFFRERFIFAVFARKKKSRNLISAKMLAEIYTIFLNTYREHIRMPNINWYIIMQIIIGEQGNGFQ